VMPSSSNKKFVSAKRCGVVARLALAAWPWKMACDKEARTILDVWWIKRTTCKVMTDESPEWNLVNGLNWRVFLLLQMGRAGGNDDTILKINDTPPRNQFKAEFANTHLYFKERLVPFHAITRNLESPNQIIKTCIAIVAGSARPVVFSARFDRRVAKDLCMRNALKAHKQR
jgi:hypothetical protein